MLRALAILVLTANVHAQWSDDPMVNLSVGDGASDQILPRVAPTADGGAYISWFDGIAGGFDVRVQKLDAQGNEVFAHNGVLVANRGFSSVQAYGLDVDASGNALLAFRDDSGVGVQITAAKVSPTGTLLWGPTNIQLTSTTQFVAAPKIAGTADGGAVVAWTQDITVHVQKLDASGSPLFGAGVIFTPAVGSFSVNDMHDAGSDAILSVTHQAGGFGSPRHIIAHKIAPNAATLWGPTGVTVFDGGSLQFGNFPSFKPDGLGGALFTWYSSSPSLQCFAQHLDAFGNELFPHNGVALSTDATRIRTSPGGAYDPVSGASTIFWTEQNAGQSMDGLWGQKLDSSGNRLWGATGSMLIPLSSTQISLVQPLADGDATHVFWCEGASFGNDILRGAHVKPSGAFDVGPVGIATQISSKLRLDTARSTAGFAILAWGDQRVDSGDVIAQNVNADLSLGNLAIGTPFCFGVGCPCGNDDPAAGCVNSSGSGAVLAVSGGSTSVGADDIVLTATGHAPNNSGLFFMGASVFPPIFVGDGHGCTGGLFRFLPGVVSPSGEFSLSSPVVQAPIGQINPGDTRHFQSWTRDVLCGPPPTPCPSPCGQNSNLSSGISIQFTP